jgi:hypothetical protein
MKFSNKKLQLLSKINKTVFGNQSQHILRIQLDDALAEKNFKLAQRCLLNIRFEQELFDKVFMTWSHELAPSELDLMIARFILMSDNK